MAESSKTATTKAAKRKPAVRKTTAKRKPAAASKAAARKPAARKTATRSAPDFTSRAQTASRNALLASLGIYGMAFDQAQERLVDLQTQLEENRAKNLALYKRLVKRGKKVEQEARVALEDIDFTAADFKDLTDRAKLEAQLAKAKARFDELRSSFGFKSAA